MLRDAIVLSDRLEQLSLVCREPAFGQAERGLVAFIAAAHQLYGSEAGQIAAQCWIEELGLLEWPNPMGPNLNQVTIAAASRLARNIVKDSPMRGGFGYCGPVS